jgi:hypothetical protein
MAHLIDRPGAILDCGYDLGSNVTDARQHSCQGLKLRYSRAMPGKFPRGAIVYTQNGRRYTVEEVTDGTAYCIGDNDAETEFAESALLSEAEWAARSEKRAGNVYDRIKRSRLYAAPAGKLDRNAAVTVLARIEKLSPGILDFTAFTIAGRILDEAGDAAPIDGLSISKCRAVFEAASPEIRAGLLAALLATPADRLIGVALLGDNLMRALIEKGMTSHAEAFDAFCDRPRS